MITTPVKQLAADYIAAGLQLCVIPQGVKGPTHKGWNEPGHELKHPDMIPPDANIGLLHVSSGTCAVDIDDMTGTREYLNERGINLDDLLNAPDAVQIVSGRVGSGKLIYRLPKGTVLPSKRINRVVAGVRKTILELRCASASGKNMQDVLPPSKHTSGTTYQWAGAGVYTAIPEAPRPILELWQQIIEGDKRSPNHAGMTTLPEWSQTRSALFHISPDVDRKDWIEIGMAIHDIATADGDAENGFQLWNEWSALGAKYKESEMRSQWGSFKAMPDGISGKTLFFHALKAGWSEPLPLGMFKPIEDPATIIARNRPKSPTVDPRLFPEVLSSMATVIAGRIGCDPIVTLHAGLMAVCGAADKRAILELLPKYPVSPILWMIVLADPSDKKSPATKAMLSYLDKLEVADSPRYAQAMANYSLNMEVYEKRRKNEATSRSKGPAPRQSNDVPPPDAELPPVKPVLLRVQVKNATSQKIMSMLGDHPRGLIGNFDEMARTVEQWNSQWSSDDRSFIVACYEGGHLSADRVGTNSSAGATGSIVLENAALGIIGNLQPDVYRAEAAAMCKDGLHQRFIPVISNSELRCVGTPTPEWFGDVEAGWGALLDAVYKLPAMTYRLSADGEAQFVAWQHELDQYINDLKLTGASAAVITAAGKLEGTVGRVALLFHIIDCANSGQQSPQVTVGTITRAIEYVRSYVIPAQVYADEVVATESSLGQWVMDWIIQHADQKVVTLRTLKRAAVRPLARFGNDREKMLRLMGVLDDLEDDGWIVKTTDDGISYQIGISQALVKAFANYRKEVVEAKQRLADSRREKVIKAGRNTAKVTVYGA